jgi:hypothetical protein
MVVLALSEIPLSWLIFPAKSWPDILLTYNPEAVEAAAKAGLELLMPEKTIPEKRLLTEEAFSKVEAEVTRLKGIISVLSYILYVIVKVFVIFVFIDYVMNLINPVPNYPLLSFIIVMVTIAIIFVAPVGIPYLIGRWARLDGYKNKSY